MMPSPCLFFFPVLADSIWCIIDRRYTSFSSRYRSIITLPLILKALSPRLRLSLRKTSRRHDSVLPCCTTCCCSIAFQMLKELEASVPVIHLHVVTFIAHVWHELRYYCPTFTKLLRISSIARSRYLTQVNIRIPKVDTCFAQAEILYAKPTSLVRDVRFKSESTFPDHQFFINQNFTTWNISLFKSFDQMFNQWSDLEKMVPVGVSSIIERIIIKVKEFQYWLVTISRHDIIAYGGNQQMICTPILADLRFSDDSSKQLKGK